MKLGAHGRNRRTSGSPSSDHEKINFYGRIAIFMKLGAHGRNRRTSGSPSSDHKKINFYGRIAIFYEIGCSRPKSSHKRVPKLDHEKMNFYGRIAIFRKLGAHGPNRRTSGPRAQIMRKSIFAQAGPRREVPNRNFQEIGCSRPKSSHKRVPELRS